MQEGNHNRPHNFICFVLMPYQRFKQLLKLNLFIVTRLRLKFWTSCFTLRSISILHLADTIFNKHLFIHVLLCVEIPLGIYTLEQMYVCDTYMKSGCVRKVADNQSSHGLSLVPKVSLILKLVYVVVGVQINFLQGSY